MDFGKLSAKKIREIIVSGENSPTELVSDILKKTDAANEHLNCFITICEGFAPYPK